MIYLHKRYYLKKSDSSGHVVGLGKVSKLLLIQLYIPMFNWSNKLYRFYSFATV